VRCGEMSVRCCGPRLTFCLTRVLARLRVPCRSPRHAPTRLPTAGHAGPASARDAFRAVRSHQSSAARPIRRERSGPARGCRRILAPAQSCERCRHTRDVAAAHPVALASARSDRVRSPPARHAVRGNTGRVAAESRTWSRILRTRFPGSVDPAGPCRASSTICWSGCRRSSCWASPS
jgi:hypothetical protein